MTTDDGAIERRPAGEPQRRLGGRSARVRRAVIDATMALFTEVGLAGLSVEKVAERAGVNRSSIYRRWGSVGALLADAVSENLAQAVPMPDTGTLRGDLRTILDNARAFLVSPLGQAAAVVVIGSPMGDDLAAVQRTIWDRRFALLGDVVQRGIDRGEIRGDIDIRAVLEVFVSPLYFRTFMLGSPPTDAYLDQMVDFLLHALAPSPRRRNRPGPAS